MFLLTQQSPRGDLGCTIRLVYRYERSGYALRPRWTRTRDTCGLSWCPSCCSSRAGTSNPQRRSLCFLRNAVCGWQGLGIRDIPLIVPLIQPAASPSPEQTRQAVVVYPYFGQRIIRSRSRGTSGSACSEASGSACTWTRRRCRWPPPSAGRCRAGWTASRRTGR